MTKAGLAVLAAALAICLGGASDALATRTAVPASVDFGTVKNGPWGGRLAATVTYEISADETLRYAYNRASGGAPDGSTQFSVGGGDCYSLFPPPPQVPASCSIVIQFDYSQSARGLSIGALVIDPDTNFDTTADQLTVPLRADVLPFLKKKKCKKKRRRAAAGAKVKRCKKKR
jgi:hypothetical protein